VKANKAKRTKNGFTLAELLVALIVSSIVLGAVAALAYALGKANDSTEELSQKQAQLRYTTIRLSRLVRYSKLVCGTPGNSLALWQADDNDKDKINPAEIVYIETGSDSNYIDLLEFDASGPAAGQQISINEIQSGAARTWLLANCTPRYIRLISQCDNLTYTLDKSTPDTGTVNISFEISENGNMQTYQITASLIGRAANLLDSTGNIVDDDDD